MTNFINYLIIDQQDFYVRAKRAQRRKKEKRGKSFVIGVVAKE